MPVFASTSRIWNAIPAAQQATQQILYARTSTTRDRINLRNGAAEAFDAVAWSVTRLQNRTAKTDVAVTIDRGNARLDSVVIYQSHTGELRWSLAGKPGEILSATRLSPDRQSALELPASGSVWQVRLPDAIAGAEQIRLVATPAPDSKPTHAPVLVVLPEARSFAGILEWSAPAKTTIQTNGLYPIREDAADRRHRPELPAAAPHLTTSYFRYRLPPNLIVQGLTSGRAEAFQHSAESLVLWSVLSGTRGMRDNHRAVFRLLPSDRRGEFAFRLDKSATVISTRLNGVSVDPVRSGETYVIQSLPVGVASVVEVRYWCASSAVGLRSSAEITAPYQTRPARDLRWYVAVPSNIQISDADTAAIVSETDTAPVWKRRLFGPLSSTSPHGVFNPLSRESWSRVLTLAKADEIPSGSADWAPTGWRIYTINGRHSEPRLTVELTDTARSRHWSWVGLLACFVLVRLFRRGRPPSRGAVAAWWFSLCLAAIWLVPPEFAEIAGGCLIGSFCAAVLPRRLSRRSEVPDLSVSGIPMGSTVSYPRVVSSLVLPAALALLTGVAAEAMQVPAEPPPAAPDPGAIVVPMGAPNGEVVYVHRRLLSRLRRDSDIRAPEYLLRAADYQIDSVTDRSADVIAKYDCVLFSSNAKIALPLKGAHLCGPTACRVNGRIHPVRRSESGDRLLLEIRSQQTDGLPARARNGAVGAAHLGGVSGHSRRATIELCLRVPIARPGQGRMLKFEIPRVLNGRVRARLIRGGLPVSMRGMATLQHDVGWFQQSVVARTGAVGSLDIREGSDPADDAADVSAQVDGVADVGGSAIQVKLRTQYRVSSGRVTSIAWNVPQNWILRHARLTNATAKPNPTTKPNPPTPLDFQIVKRSRRRRQLRIDLPEPKSQSFEVIAEFVVPMPNATGAIRLSVPQLHAGTRVKETRVRFGVGSSAEYKLSLSPADSGLLQPLDPRSLADFSKVFPSADMAFAVSGPVQLRGRLIRRSPQRHATQRNHLHVHRDRLDLRWTADIDVQKAPVFVHQLSVDPRLRIHSVSVIEDQAPRLASWSRTNNVVWLFLNSETSARQRIVVTGTMPARPGMKFRPPVISFLNATVAENILSVVRDRTVGVTTQNPGDSKPTGGEAAGGGPGTAIVGEYRIDGGPRLPEFRMRSRTETIRIERVTALRVDDSGVLSWEVAIKFGDLLPATAYAVRIPASMADLLTMDEADWILERREEAGDAVDWICRPRKADKMHPLVFRVHAVPRAEGVNDLPLPQSLDGALAVDVLTMTRGSRQLSVVSRASRSRLQQLPQWMQSRIANSGATIFRNRDRSGSWQLSHDAQPTVPRPRVPLMETTLWDRDGRTEFFVVDTQEMKLSWPTGLTTERVLVDGQPVDARPADSQTWTLRLPNGNSHHVRIDWRSDSTHSSWSVARIRRALPVPLSLPVETSLLSVQPARGATVVALAGLKKSDDASLLLEQLERLLDVALNASASLNVIDRAVSRAVETEQRLSRLLGAKASDSESIARFRSRYEEARRRLQTVKERIAAESDQRPIAFALRPASAGWDSSAIRGRVEMSGQETAVEYRSLSPQLVSVVLAAGIVIVFLPFFRRVVGLQLGERLAGREPISWMLLGLFWFFFLAPAGIGLVLLGVAGWKAVRNRIRARQVGNVVQLFERAG